MRVRAGLFIGKANSYEGALFGEENLQGLQNRPPQGCGAGHLQKPETQATARLAGYLLLVISYRRLLITSNK